MPLRSWLAQRIAHFLTRPVRYYEHHARHDFTRLRRHARKGDVLLVAGDQRVSTVIKAFTQSCWSHAALYIGDELLRGPALGRQLAIDRFGPEGARHLLVEALFEGVVISPLDKYRDFHVRLCRPHGLRGDDLRVVLGGALASVGWRYDLHNILGLARHLVLMGLFPTRYRRRVERLGSGAPTEVICSSLIGQLYRKVGFPVLPVEATPLPPPRRGLGRWLRRERAPYPGIFRPRHPTLLAPRDFDLSPYFDIVKFDALADGDFDYRRIPWVEDGPPPALEVAAADDQEVA